MKHKPHSAPIFYEVNIRQYTPEGNFNAFMEHLPRLKEMGVEVLWLMPIHPIGKINRKGVLGSYYSISDFYGINPEFGTINDFKLLVDEIHHYGMKIIIDWVANHTSWDNDWTNTNTHFFAKNMLGKNYAPFDWDDVVQLDHSNPDQQHAMATAMNYWVEECNIDGFRCDMAHLTPLTTWRIAKKLCESKKGLIWLAETEDESYYEIFDTIYGWEWLHACNAFAKSETTLDKLRTIINKYVAALKHGKSRLMFTTNHDENSWNGTEFERLGFYAQLLTALSWLLPGAPLVYTGQEIPLSKRLSFFEKDTISWNSYSNTSFISSIFHLCNEHKCMINRRISDFEWLGNIDPKNVLSFMYHFEGKKLIVIANMSINKVECVVNDNKLWSNYQEVFCIKKGVSSEVTEDTQMELNEVNFSNSLILEPLQLLIFSN